MTQQSIARSANADSKLVGGRTFRYHQAAMDRSTRRGNWAWAMAAAALGSLLGCQASGSRQPLAPAERMKLEHDRDLVEDQYAETLTQLRRYELASLDARHRAANDSLAAVRAEWDRSAGTLGNIESQQRDLVGQIEHVGSTTQPAGEWADRLAALRLLKGEAELSRVTIQRQLVLAEEELAAVRQLLAQREMLARQGLAQEKRLLELNRKLK